MPSITIDIAPLSREQKAQIAKELTESASRITGIDPWAFYVFINEYPRDCIGVGGELLSDRRPRDISDTMNRTAALLAVLIVVAVLAVAAAVFINSPGGGQDAPPDDGTVPAGKVAVVCFSETGNTERIAKEIAGMTGGDFIRITPEVPYTAADRDYSDSGSRTRLEQNDASARPAIANSIDISGYSAVFLGYPIWYGDSPKIMWTFVETHGLEGKTVIPFCTSSSSGVGSSDDHLKALSDGGNWLGGKRFSSTASQSEIRSWISGLGLEAPA